MNNFARRVHETMERIECETPAYTLEPVEMMNGDNSRYANREDGEILHVESVREPNEVLSDNPEDLATMLVAYFKKAYRSKRGHLPYRNYIADTVEHEAEHGEFMGDIGVEDIKYGVSLYRNYYLRRVHGEKRYVAQWTVQPLTTFTSPIVLPKVLYAMWFAYPTEPSPGDNAFMEQMGYRDPLDVYERSLAVPGIPHIKPLSL